MSLLRKFAAFILSSIFVISLSLFVTSYVFGDRIQKDSLKSFVKSEMVPGMMGQQCDEICKDFDEIERIQCLQVCREQIETNTTEEIESSIDTFIDQIYEKEVMSISLSDITYILSLSVLLGIVTLITGALLFLASEKPFSSVGWNLITVSIYLLIIGFAPNFIPSGGIGTDIVQSAMGFIFEGLEKQITFGVVFLIIGIVFVIVHYYIEYRKSKKTKKTKKLEKVKKKSKK
jgi:hypothetical protein